MGRPKANTEAGKKAAAKWRKTMLEKYGGKEGLRRQLQYSGRIGGSHSRGGGFASNPELARIAGSIGGRKSRRGAGSVIQEKIEPQRERIEQLYKEGLSIPQIAKELNLSYNTLLKWAKTDLDGYGEH